MFDDTADKLRIIISNSNIPIEEDFEILPALFVLADYAAASAGDAVKRQCKSKELLTHVTETFDSDSIRKFDRRVVLYGEAIRGNNLRGEWCFGNTDDLAKDAVGKIAIVLGDILVNPGCAEAYDTAPVCIYDIFTITEFFATVMKPIHDLLIIFFKDVYDSML